MLIPKVNSKTEHPRARGENLVMVSSIDRLTGTSPRTRGKLVGLSVLPYAPRNIPAHAGKTSAVTAVAKAALEHPRARGENTY